MRRFLSLTHCSPAEGRESVLRAFVGKWVCGSRRFSIMLCMLMFSTSGLLSWYESDRYVQGKVCTCTKRIESDRNEVGSGSFLIRTGFGSASISRGSFSVPRIEDHRGRETHQIIEKRFCKDKNNCLGGQRVTPFSFCSYVVLFLVLLPFFLK